MTGLPRALERFALDGRVAVVTGGAGRYGRQITTVLAQAGAHVVLTARDPGRAGTEATLLALAVGGTWSGAAPRVSGLALDQGDEASVTRFFDQLHHLAGRLDVLVNNAVHRQGGGLADTDAADWDATSRINSRGLFLLCKNAATVMADHGGGAIVNIGSMYGVAAPDFSVYEGTDLTTPAFYAYDKAGMVGLTRYLAAWLGPQGIRVNCLAPGGLADGTQPEQFVEAYRQRTPLRRMAAEGDMAGPLLLLATDAGSYLTGQTLVVDGGYTL